MAKMWQGVTDGNTDKIADDFNSSIHFDKRMYKQDITGSMAHASMLSAQKIITEKDCTELLDGLQTILQDIEDGALPIPSDCEDIHMFVEQELTKRKGEVGKKLHTARSRNDQVALDIRLYLNDTVNEIVAKLKTLLGALTQRAEEHKNTIMPGYTHLQRAQPITFGHQLMAYGMMFKRDIERFSDNQKRILVSPIGSCALAGTTYPTDRQKEASLLGMNEVCQNSIDGVSDRDFAVEFISNCSLLMMHLSRFCEELVLWSSWEFKFVEISDAFTTGSSIMPQKKNPDMAELIRGKTGRVYGDLMALLTVLKGLPLAYNKDMQEDKESIFDACDTVRQCLDVFIPMIQTMNVRPDRMKKSAQEGFINATDVADYLVGKGLPFRSAYKISGQIVAYCMESGFVLETLPLEKYKEFDSHFDSDIYQAVDLVICVQKRISEGGTSVASVEKQIAYIQNFLHT